MTSRHDIMLLCKSNINNIFELKVLHSLLGVQSVAEVVRSGRQEDLERMCKG